MNQLKLETLCSGILAVRGNAAELITEAEILLAAKRFSRAYALAYTACEELGKIPILVGAATDVALRNKVNWKRLRQRFLSHDSKAIQFVGVDALVGFIINSENVSNKLDAIEYITDLLGSSKGIFATRNTSLYTEFDGNAFVVHTEKFNEKMVHAFLGLQKGNSTLLKKSSVGLWIPCQRPLGKGLTRVAVAQSTS